MGINKVKYGNTTLIDISSDTVTPSTLLEGYTAHDNTGTLITGTAHEGGDVPVWQGGDDYVYFSDTVPPPYEISMVDGYVVIDLPSAVLQSKSASYTPTETAQSETITADSGYDGLSSVSVSVGAISSSYVGSGITRRSSTDLSVSGDTITAPSGYYSASASKSVASGSAGTPTATKGAVSNHSVSVTPSVTNTTGYITGGTKSGTGVSVSASELVSGTKSITENGTGIDVTNYASVDVAVPIPVETHTVTITGAGESNYVYVRYNDVKYYSLDDTITVNDGNTVSISIQYGDDRNELYINDELVAGGQYQAISNYQYTVNSDVEIRFVVGRSSSYGYITECSGFATATATMVQVGVNSAKWEVAHFENGELKASIDIPYDTVTGVDVEVVLYNGESVSTLLADSIYDIQGDATYNSSTNVLTITGDCVIVYEGVDTTPTLIPLNVTQNGTYDPYYQDADGYSPVTVNVGPQRKYRATIKYGTGDSTNLYVMYPYPNGTKYYTVGDFFEVEEGETLYLYTNGGDIYVNGNRGSAYSYEIPAKADLDIELYEDGNGSIYVATLYDANTSIFSIDGGDENNCYVTVNNIKYYGGTMENPLEVPVKSGDVIHMYCIVPTGTFASISINFEEVASSEQDYVSYDYTVPPWFGYGTISMGYGEYGGTILMFFSNNPYYINFAYVTFKSLSNTDTELMIPVVSTELYGSLNIFAGGTASVTIIVGGGGTQLNETGAFGWHNLIIESGEAIERFGSVYIQGDCTILIEDGE